MLKVIQEEHYHLVVDQRNKTYFQGTEIECQQFIVRTTLEIERIVIIEYKSGTDYRAYTNYGVVDVSQICNKDSKYDKHFYTVDFGTISDRNFKEILIETLAWHLSFNDYVTACANNQPEETTNPFN